MERQTQPSRHLSRRRFLAGSTLALAGLLAAGVPSAGNSSAETMAPAARPTTARPAVELRVLDGADDAPLIRTDLADFRNQHPEIFVDLTVDDTPAALHDRLVEAFVAGQAPDVTYLTTEQAGAFAGAAWLRDLTGLPGEAELAKDELGFVGEQTHLFGRRYATVAGVRLRCFMYNWEHLAKAGVAEVPSTLPDLARVATELQLAKADNFAFYWTVKNGAGLLAGDYVANGKDLFDAGIDPSFLRDPLYVDVLNWHLDAVHTWKIVNPKGFVSEDTDESFPHGWASFTWASYDSLKEWQDPGRYRAGGKLANGLCPSLTAGKHATIGEAQLYAVTRATALPDQSWLLARYLGGTDGAGQLTAPTRRWLVSGRGLGYRSLVDDPKIREATGAWGDTSAYFQQLALARPPTGITAGWFREWRAFASVQSGLMLRRAISIREYLDRIGRRWTSLRNAWTSSRGLP